MSLVAGSAVSGKELQSDEPEANILNFGLLSEDDDERMLIDIFLDESIDLIDAISHALDVWQDDPNDLGPVIELQRDLHTLKGGCQHG